MQMLGESLTATLPDLNLNHADRLAKYSVEEEAGYEGNYKKK